MSEETGPINLGNPEEIAARQTADAIAIEAGGAVDSLVDFVHGIAQTVRWYGERSVTAKGTIER